MMRSTITFAMGRRPRLPALLNGTSTSSRTTSAILSKTRLYSYGNPALSHAPVHRTLPVCLFKRLESSQSEGVQDKKDTPNETLKASFTLEEVHPLPVRSEFLSYSLSTKELEGLLTASSLEKFRDY